jgi:coronin-1B/1C/6
MSGRFVRASKYRHVHGEPARKDKCYNNIRPTTDGDGNFIKANKKFLAFGSVGGGGPIVVHPLKNVGRLDNTAPTINVHKAKILDFDFSPFLDCLIASASEDCLIKVTVFPEEGLTGDISEAAATLEGHQKKVTLVHFHPTANNILASTAHDHSLRIWDIQQQKQVLASTEEHTDVIQSFEWNESGSMIATASKDKFIRIYDPRDNGSMLKAPGFGGTKGSRVAWADRLNKLLAVGFSATSVRQYSVYDYRKFSEPLATSDIDQTAGVLIPYYDPDNSVLYLAGKGDGNIRYFEVVDEDPYIHYLSEFRSNESQKGACFLPKLACETKDCEIAVALRLMRDFIQPVSFQVPRKSDIFQGDIYPDTYAGIPALSEEEWLAGQNKEPPKVSMKDKNVGGGSGSSAVVFVAQKSAAELQKELNEAHERIKQLEAEVAKLKGQ